MARASLSITKCISARALACVSPATLVCALCAVALVSCGGDDEGDETERAGTTTSPARTDSPAVTAPQAETAPPETAPPATAERETQSPEDQPGGAGDEEPARSQALFTGRGGQIRPRIVLVPPFIAVQVELRSGDGRRYSLSAGRRRLDVGSGVSSVSTTFDGLRPGRRVILRGTGGRVIVEASAEPGP
jgi:hypothetical protein